MSNLKNTKSMREYEQAKHKLSRIVLFEIFVGVDEFTIAEFRMAFQNQEMIFGIRVRTPSSGDRSGYHTFLQWSDRIRRLLDHYCDHVGRGKMKQGISYERWRVNLSKKAWNLK